MNEMTQEEIAAVFTEWERRYREEPEKFESDYARFTSSVESYGEGASAYFVALANEMFPR